MAFTDDLRREFQKKRAGVVAIDLLEIEDLSGALAEPIRLANNTEDITSDGVLFQAMRFVMPRGSEGFAPEDFQITIFDTKKEVLAQLESIPPRGENIVVVRYFLVSDLDLDERELQEEYQHKSESIDESGSLILNVLSDLYLSVTIPAHNFTPDLYPAIHPTFLGP
ncbi:MAG: hypothetical protein K2X93_06745 [Candidatus Obscuribacterales bacterium]|nr:hypothetical protein [Candidatus Obscuribacterales bacterium]